MTNSQIVRFTILFVDDDKNDMQECIEKLRVAVPAAVAKAWPKHLPVPSIEFVPLSPHANESKDDFIARFSRILRVEEPIDVTGCNWQSIAEDLQFILLDLNFKTPFRQVDFGLRLAEVARDNRPLTPRGLISILPLQRSASHGDSLCHEFLDKGELNASGSAENVMTRVLARIARRTRTPFWSGLRAFSADPKVVMHAMATADVKHMQVSRITDDYLAAFAEQYMRHEASSTQPPLDSLFTPRGTLKQSLELVARAFNADFAWISTNGTSTANKIVHTAITAPGEIVMVDRACHISHHYAVALCHTVPLYLDNTTTKVAGIPGPVTADQVSNQLAEVIEATSDDFTRVKARLPSLIAITHSTFDGLYVDPADIFHSVSRTLSNYGISDRLSEIAFLFDEAWFSYAYFHPHFSRFAALNAAARVCALPTREGGAYFTKQLRVYSTQSLHKTGAALRQASVILARDPCGEAAIDRLTALGHQPNTDYLLSRRFKQAFKCHTTTSPSLPLIASVDIARLQFELEGVTLVQRAIEAANTFRSAALATPSDGDESGLYFGAVFRPLSIEDFYDPGSADRIFLDPTKLTVRVPLALGGNTLRHLLWEDEECRVQINKYAHDTLLLMFMPGMTTSWTTTLIARLASFVNKNASKLGKALSGSAEIATDWLQAFSATEFCVDGRPRRLIEAVSEGSSPNLYDPLFATPPDCFDLTLDADGLIKVSAGVLFAAEFVVPYPPGFPLLLPGQRITNSDVEKLIFLGDAEVHGTHGETGTRRILVFGEKP